MSGTTTPPVRILDGIGVPAAGRWRIDPGHAEVGFVGKHLLFSKVRGRFRSFEGTIDISAESLDSTVDVTIDVASVDSGDAIRDDHLRSADLFDVEQFPTATFHGRARRWSGGAGTVLGQLTIKGVTRPVELDVAALGVVADPWGGERAIFSATGRLNRKDWGITWNLPLAGGGLLVSDDIQLEIEVETILDR
jgi:polyisoprenoid-binding protein YceI